MRKHTWSVGLLLACLAFQTSCRLGSDYSTTSPTVAQSGDGTDTNTQNNQVGDATSLVLQGPATIKVDGCRGPFVVEARDDKGRSGALLPSGALIRIGGLPPGTAMFSNNGCSTSLTDGPTVPSGGSTRVEFYLSPTTLGAANLVATKSGLADGRFTTTVVAGSPHNAVISLARRFQAFRCVPASIYLRDSRSNLTTAEQNIDFDVSISNLARVTLHRNANCTSPVSSVRINRGNSESDTFYVFASQPGDGLINASPNLSGLLSPSKDFTVLNDDAPRLVLSAVAGNHVVHTCLAVTVLSQTSTGDALAVRVPTTVQLGTSVANFSFYANPGCTGSAISSVDLNTNSSQATVYGWTDVGPQTVTLSANSPNYSSASLATQWIAGAPKRIQLFGLSPTALVGDTMPAVARLKDDYGNFAVVGSRTAIMMNKGNASVGNARILAGSCSGPEVSQIHVEVANDSSAFCLLFTRPGLFSLEAASSGLTSALADVLIGPQAGAATSLVFETASSATAGDCVPFTLRAFDSFGNPHAVTADSQFLLESISPTAQFYSQTNPCSGVITSVTMATGASTATGFWSETKSGTTTLSTRRDPPVPAPLTANTTVTIRGGAPDQVEWQGVPANGYPGQVIGPLTLLAKDQFGNPATLSAALVSGLALVTTSDTVFSHDDPTFASPITQVSIPANANKLERIFLRTRTQGQHNLTATPVNNAIGQAVSPLEILPPPATTLRLTASNLNPRAGDCVTMGATLVDNGGNTVVLDPALVTLDSDSPIAGVFKTIANCNNDLDPAQVNLTPAVPMGAFVVKTTVAGPLRVNAALVGTSQTDSVTLNVDVGTGRRLVLNNSGPSDFFIDEAGGAYLVALQDQFGNAVRPNADLALTVNGSPSGLSATSDSDPSSGAPFILASSGIGTFYLHASAAGPYSITATANGVTSAARTVTVHNRAPGVTGVNPPQGPIAGGTPVTISGSGFVANSVVKFDADNCTNVQISASQITCVTPAHASDVVDVTVTPPFGDPGTLPDAFRYIGPPPGLTSINPPQGPVAGGTPVTITGSGFIDVAEVKIGGVDCVSVNVQSPTEIRCTTPPHAAGRVDVLVRLRLSYPGTLSQAFAYLMPPSVISTVNPAEGPQAGGTAVTIVGTGGFRTGAQVSFGGSSCAVAAVNDLEIQCTTSAHAPGLTSLTITQADTFPSTKPDAFRYLGAAPTVSGVLPTSGSYNGGTPVTISGSGFVGPATVDFGGSACNSVNVVSGSEIRCTTTAHAPGLVNVSVRNASSFPGSLPQAYNYLPAGPGVTSISPASGPAAGGTAVTIVGSGFVGTPNVYLDGVACQSINRVSATEIRCVTPPHAPCLATVTVANPGTMFSVVPGGFRYLGNAPVINAISPNYGSYQGLTPVTISGSGFVSGAQVTLGGSACNSVVVTPPGRITCTTSGHAAAVVDVSVSQTQTLPGSTPNLYTYVGAPVLNPPNGNPPGIVPASGRRGVATRVTISGNHLASPAAPPTVTVGGLTCAIYSYNASQIVCDTSPALANGPHAVSVSHLGGSVTGLTFTVYDITFHPTESISPLIGTTFGGTRLTIKGSGLVDANGGTQVKLDGIVCPLVSAAATQIVCNTPAHAAGAVNVVVSHSGNSATAPQQFTYVDCSSPNAVVNASAQTLFQGHDGAAQNAHYNAGGNVPKWWNPYYGPGDGLNYYNNDASRLRACRLQGYSQVVAYTAGSWSSPHNNATMIWNDALSTFDIWNGSWSNTYTRTYTCRGQLNNACVVDKRWIFPQSTPARWHNVKELYCPTFCSLIGHTNTRSQEGFRCVSGENQAASAYPVITYRNGYKPQKYIPGSTSGDTSSGDKNEECYRPGQTHDHNGTDKTFGCFCSR